MSEPAANAMDAAQTDKFLAAVHVRTIATAYGLLQSRGELTQQERDAFLGATDWLAERGLDFVSQALADCMARIDAAHRVGPGALPS